MYTKGKWFCHNDFIENGEHVIAVMNNIGDKVESDTNLIVAAVNACVKVNPDNPMAVAESISAMYEALKGISDFLYGYSESESRVPSEWYHKFKEKYLQGYAALAKAEGKEEKHVH